MRIVNRPAALLYASLICIALASCKGATSIRDLMDDPHRYDGKTVRIVGEVQSAIGALGVGEYQVNDGTGVLSVVTRGGGVPRQGAKIGVQGTFRSAFTFGAKTGAVLLEDRRYTP